MKNVFKHLIYGKNKKIKESQIVWHIIKKNI